MNEVSQRELEDSTPLTKWKNAPKLSDLKQDLLVAKPIHDEQTAQIKVWLDNLNVEGAAKIKVADGNSAIVPKLIRKQAEWRYAALSEPFLSTPDIFKVKPKTWEDREAAQQNQILLNYQFNTAIDKIRFIDEYVRAAVDEGTVIIRVGWEFEEEEYDAEEPVIEFTIDPSFAETLQQVQMLKEQSPSQFDTDVPEELKQALDLSMEQGQPVRPTVTGTQTVKKMRTIVNRPTVEVCNYQNVTFDPTCMGVIEKAGFAVYSFETSLSVLRKDKRYKNLDKINVAGNSILSQPDHAPNGGENNFNFRDDPRKKFVVHEYWGFWDIDGTGKVKPFVASWVGETFIRMEENPFPDKAIPFIVEQYLPVRRATYGEPDGALLEDNQKVIGAVTRGMIDLMAKSANGQTGMRKDMLDVTNKRKFDKGQDYEFNGGVDPNQGVYMHKFAEIPNSAQFMLQLQNYEAESLTGVKSYSSGISGSSLGDVAAGVRGALDAASKRELGILRRLSNGITKLGRKMIAMNSEFLSDEEVVRVTNEQFVKVRKEDLAGEFDLELSISTAEEDNNKAEQLAFMFQTIGPNGDQGMTSLILSDIARLRKMPELAEKIENYQPQPDPMQQKIQQLEIEKLMAEVEEIRARALQYQAKAQLDGAKVGTESVKQGNLQSDTDQKNLNFVEQESGVTQERDKELHGAQAESQLKLKQYDHQIKREEMRHNLVKEYVKSKAKK